MFVQEWNLKRQLSMKNGKTSEITLMTVPMVAQVTLSLILSVSFSILIIDLSLKIETKKK